MTTGKLAAKSKKLDTVIALGVLGAFDEAAKAISVAGFQAKLGGLTATGTAHEQENFLTRLPSEQIRTLLQEAIACTIMVIYTRARPKKKSW